MKKIKFTELTVFLVRKGARSITVFNIFCIFSNQRVRSSLFVRLLNRSFVRLERYSLPNLLVRTRSMSFHSIVGSDSEGNMNQRPRDDNIQGGSQIDTGAESPHPVVMLMKLSCPDGRPMPGVLYTPDIVSTACEEVSGV